MEGEKIMNKFLKTASYILVLTGALNWGLVGLFNFDLVAYLFGDMTLLTRFIYAVVGASAVVAAIAGHMYEKRCCIEE